MERRMKSPVKTLSIAFAMAGVLLIQPASAQDPSNAGLKEEIQALSDVIKSVQKEVQEVKALLQQPRAGAAPSPQNVVLDLANHPFKGKAAAKLTLVEFSDFQCPFCERHVRETDPQLAKEYLETGKLKIVFMDFPLEAIHGYAFKAAEAARCSGEQGKFWEMHDQLFRSQKTSIDFSNWTAHAAAVGLNVRQFESCLSSGKYAPDIRKDVAQGVAAGVSGTPGFFLAMTDAGSTKVETMRFISGAQPFSAFKAQIDALLAESIAKTSAVRK
jgi:protein-disulfide isomerase